jgi:hypothetical protein
VTNALNQSVVTIMTEQRTTQRSRTLKSGTISFDRAAGIDCVVRNISAEGACLEVTGPLGIPDEFTLVIKPDSLFRKCQIVWRSARRIGVRFT